MHSSTASSSSPGPAHPSRPSIFHGAPAGDGACHKLEREITVRIVDTFWPRILKSFTLGLYLIKRSTLLMVHCCHRYAGGFSTSCCLIICFDWGAMLQKSHEYGNQATGEKKYHFMGKVSWQKQKIKKKLKHKTLELWLFKQLLCNCESTCSTHIYGVSQECQERCDAELTFFYAQNTWHLRWDDTNSDLFISL